MYTSYFGFKENPFSLTPDPDYLYLSRHHQAAFDHLLYGINERKGFIVITGGIGTGKTTLCRALLSTLDESTKTALVLNAYISDIELLRTINQEFGIDGTSSSETKKDYIDNLNKFLLENYSRHGNAVLLVDEAQNLSHTVLEQIRMLSNLETEKEKLVQIVLVGQLELRELLSSPSLKQLDERITVRFDLKPLDRQDVQGYVEHRLVVAGGKGSVRFTRGGFGEIYAYSRGNPRRINAVCDRALLIAYSKDQATVTKKTVRKAVEDISGAIGLEAGGKPGWFSKKVAALTALLVLLVIGAGLGGWQMRKALSPAVSNEAKVSTNPSAAQPLAEEETAEESIIEEKLEVVAAEPEETPALSSEAEARAATLAAVPPVPTEAIATEEEVAAENETIDLAKLEEPSPAQPEAEVKPATLFMDEQASVGELFRAYYARKNHKSGFQEGVHLGIYSFHAEPELYVMFKKPFRVRVTLPPDQAGAAVGPMGQHLLISEVTPDGAVAIDADGKERRLDRDFLFKHWGYEVCWIYPLEEDSIDLIHGTYGPEVIELQRRLNDAGYLVEITGIYDEPTFGKVVRLQTDFGLQADGIVGQRTKGLLYQISN